MDHCSWMDGRPRVPEYATWWQWCEGDTVVLRVGLEAKLGLLAGELAVVSRVVGGFWVWRQREAVQLGPFDAFDLASPSNTLGRTLLHHVIASARPAAVVEAVLAAHPAAAGVADDDGALPLHLAAEAGCEPEVLQLLKRAHPAGDMGLAQAAAYVARATTAAEVEAALACVAEGSLRQPVPLGLLDPSAEECARGGQNGLRYEGEKVKLRPGLGVKGGLEDGEVAVVSSITEYSRLQERYGEEHARRTAGEHAREHARRTFGARRARKTGDFGVLRACSGDAIFARPQQARSGAAEVTNGGDAAEHQSYRDHARHQLDQWLDLDDADLGPFAATDFVRVFDSTGSTLLHYAVACACPLAVLGAVLAAHPESAGVTDGDGALPLQLAREIDPRFSSEEAMRLLDGTEDVERALLACAELDLLGAAKVRLAMSFYMSLHVVPHPRLHQLALAPGLSSSAMQRRIRIHLLAELCLAMGPNEPGLIMHKKSNFSYPSHVALALIVCLLTQTLVALHGARGDSPVASDPGRRCAIDVGSTSSDLDVACWFERLGTFLWHVQTLPRTLKRAPSARTHA